MHILSIIEAQSKKMETFTFQLYRGSKFSRENNQHP